MKIIDEKGKLFGKINLIDFLALVLIVAALVLLVVRFLLPADTTSGEKKKEEEETKLTYTALVQAVDPATYQEVLRQIEDAGGKDQLMANGELVDDAYITEVKAVPHEGYNYTSDGEAVLFVEDFEGGRLDLTFTVEAIVDDPIINRVGTQEVRVAKGHILKTVHFEFPYSTIMSCDWE